MFDGPENIRRHHEKPPKQTEKRKQCRRCGYRTVHVYDHGLNRFICSEHELGDVEAEEGRRRRFER
jgi:hypothetical protein